MVMPGFPVVAADGVGCECLFQVLSTAMALSLLTDVKSVTLPYVFDNRKVTGC